jgi:hypothetical protein
MRQVFWRNTLSSIFDLDKDRFALCRNHHSNYTSRRGMAHSIVEKVLQRIFHTVCIR